jgi:hypothetical protein
MKTMADIAFPRYRVQRSKNGKQWSDVERFSSRSEAKQYLIYQALFVDVRQLHWRILFNGEVDYQTTTAKLNEIEPA